MTLRDCTIFIQVPRELFPPQGSLDTPQDRQGQVFPAVDMANGTPGKHAPREIRIVIADLDKKDQEVRGEYWRSIEEQLSEGGYYVGAGKTSPEEKDCDLRDVVWSSEQVVWNHCAI
jgi:hypothetical protein